jgi:membrane-associated phospholipid phosphatase
MTTIITNAASRVLAGRIHLLFLLLPCLAIAPAAWAQDKTAEEEPSPSQKTNHPERHAEPADQPKYLLKHLVQDQLAIWSGPFKMKAADLKWVVPIAGITTGLIVTDRTASHEASRLTSFNTARFSDIGLAVAGGTSAGLYMLGRRRGDVQLRESGVLAGEAMVDALAVDEVLKYAFQRQRPSEVNGAGRFFQTGSLNSFPSAHATLAFAAASVLAHEYKGWLTQGLAYGGASAISLARVTGKQHFPSDVFIGGTLGYLIGRDVYRTRHQSDLDQANYGIFVSQPTKVDLNSAGATYVELDSWIYPALDRLIALEVIRSPFLGLRPWTRTAIAQMLADTHDVRSDLREGPQIAALYSLLKTEFSSELNLAEEPGVNQSIRLESVYARTYAISGTPLNDSYHFGQTIINDFGRPYWGGFNAVSGFTSRAEAGHFSFYVRGEYQNADAAPPYPANVRAVILQVDQNCSQPGQPCPQPASPAPGAKQFRLLDTYVGFAALGNDISIGKQSMWWGPGQGGAMIFSDNAEPFYMVRITRTLPLRVPLLSRLLGPLRYDHFFGKPSEHHFPPQAFMYGDKVSFQPTANLEIGFSRTAVFAGQGKTPLTFGTFWRSFTSVNDVPPSDKATPRDPGARHGAFDFSYRLPFLRKWVTLYGDSIVHDDVSPLDAPRRAAIVPGLYFSHLPRLNNLDLRVESGYTDIPPIPAFESGRFLYWEQVYHDVYTNKGNLQGSWIGRSGKGTQAWSNYWLSPLNSIQVAFRNAKISPQFIPGGGTQNDYSAGTRLRLRKELELSANFQYEQWNLPVLAASRKSDFLSSIQLTLWPQESIKSRTKH